MSYSNLNLGLIQLRTVDSVIGRILVSCSHAVEQHSVPLSYSNINLGLILLRTVDSAIERVLVSCSGDVEQHSVPTPIVEP